MVPQSGHTIEAPHIEPPTFKFRVSWYQHKRPTAVNGVCWEAGQRWVYVKALTPEGAIEVAKYHYKSGQEFELQPAIDVWC